MKTALITTTINVPKVLALYRKLGPYVRFFVAGDQKTPEDAVNYCTHDIPDCHFIFTSEQDKWRCSKPLGWNTVRRRNMALLEALKWGAEIIVTVDDDNHCIGEYFQHFDYIFGSEFSGLKATSPSCWFDAGQLMTPQTPHRGFPYDRRAQPAYEPVTDIKIGVAAGLCLGDPDIDAVTRIANAPIVHGVSELARAGVVIDPRETWTVFNTQNTAFIRELAPAMFCAPGLGRFDDIFASLITQRVMREKDLHVHFGQPFVWQQRNSHNLISDLKEETFGMEHLVHLAGILDHMPAMAVDKSPVRQIYEKLDDVSWFPPIAVEAGLAWCDDVEMVL